MTQQVRGSDLYAACSQFERGFHAFRVGDHARGDNRDVDSLDDLPHQCERADLRRYVLRWKHAAVRVMPAWTGELEFDQTRNPRQLNWIAVTSAGQKLPDNRCIYDLHGDTWLMIGGGAHDRPEHFFCGGGDGRQTLVLKRQNAAKEPQAR